MRISEAIRRLSTIRAFHGDVEVEHEGCCDRHKTHGIYFDKDDIKAVVH